MPEEKFFLVNITSPMASADLEFLTGGWMPLSENFVGGTGICAFTTKANAEAHITHYKNVMTQSGAPVDSLTFDVDSFDKSGISRLAKALKFPNILIDPVRDSSFQMNVNEFFSADEFVINQI